ncbi:MAG: ATPase domain-containing protein [Nanoarchaeota archaeon]
MAIVQSLKIPRDELNRNFGGGLPMGGLVLIEGNDGGGKSIISQRMAYGLLENDYTVSYISTELNLMGFIQQMDSLKYRITDKIIAEDLLFISMFPQLGNVRLKSSFLRDLLNCQKLFSTDVIIIDTISYLLLNEDVKTEDIFYLLSFIKKITSLNKTLILCTNPEQCNKIFLEHIRGISDVYLKSEAKTVLGNLLHVINVIRYKKALKEVTNTTAFKVIPGAGFALELASLA